MTMISIYVWRCLHLKGFVECVMKTRELVPHSAPIKGVGAFYILGALGGGGLSFFDLARFFPLAEQEHLNFQGQNIFSYLLQTFFSYKRITSPPPPPQRQNIKMSAPTNTDKLSSKMRNFDFGTFLPPTSDIITCSF